MTIAIILAISALVGGGTSVAASAALPGDVLYPVKTGVNESVRSFFAFSPEARAQVEANLALRRIEEIERLSVRGTINEELAAEIEARFRAHAERVAQIAEELEADKSLEVSSEFESELRNHRSILARLAARESDDANILISLSSDVNTAASNAVRIKGNAEARLGADVSVNNESRAEGKLNAAENKIEEVKNYLALKAEASAEAKAEANAKLSVAENYLAQGKARMEAGAYAESFVLFNKAHQAAQEAKLAIASSLDTRLNVDVQVNDTDNDNNNASENRNNAEVRTGGSVNSENGNNGASGSVEVEVGL